MNALVSTIDIRGQYISGDAVHYDFNRSFDIIVLSNVLEHIHDRVDFLRRISEVAPTILVRVPAIDRDWLTLYKKEMGVEWRLDSTHFTEYTLASFNDEVTASGLQLLQFSVQFGEIWAILK